VTYTLIGIVSLSAVDNITVTASVELPVDVVDDDKTNNTATTSIEISLPGPPDGLFEIYLPLTYKDL
jgi:hypothetical protein